MKVQAWCFITNYYYIFKGEKEYTNHFNTFDKLSESQTEFAEKQFNLFNEWWKNWESN